jgi:hypothetical protein
MNQPRNRLPDTLMNNVAHGNAMPVRRSIQTDTAQRVTPPIADPNATSTS